MYAYVDASTYSSTWTTTKPTYYKTRTMYISKVNGSCAEYNQNCYTDVQYYNSCTGYSSCSAGGHSGGWCDGNNTCHFNSYSGCYSGSNWCGQKCENGSCKRYNQVCGSSYSSTSNTGCSSRTEYAEVTGWGSRVSVTTPGSNTTTRKYQYSRDSGVTWVDCDKTNGCPTS